MIIGGNRNPKALPAVIPKIPKEHAVDTYQQKKNIVNRSITVFECNEKVFFFEFMTNKNSMMPDFNFISNQYQYMKLIISC